MPALKDVWANNEHPAPDASVADRQPIVGRDVGEASGSQSRLTSPLNRKGLRHDQRD